MTLEKQLKEYITNLFNLPKDEKWECESIEEVADNILPDQYISDLVRLPTKSFIRILTTLTHFMKGIYTPLSSTIKNNLLRLVILMKQTIWTSYIFITQLCHY